MRLIISIVLILVASPAFGQTYSPPDAELWALMTKALQDLPMTYSTHQQVQQILANVQGEARMREMRAKAQNKTEESK